MTCGVSDDFGCEAAGVIHTNMQATVMDPCHFSYTY